MPEEVLVLTRCVNSQSAKAWLDRVPRPLFISPSHD